MIEIYKIQVQLEKALNQNSSMLDYISESKKYAVNRYRQSVDVHRSILGEILTRIAICNRLGASNNEIVFSRNEYNKPLLTVPSGYFFNVSHSGDWVVCAFADHLVGIDVECMKPIEVSLAEHFFSQGESEKLNSMSGIEQLKGFYQLWTLKESYVKAVGKGLSMPLDTFHADIRKDNQIVAEFKEGAPHAFFQQKYLDDIHVMSVCTFHQDTVLIKHLDYSVLEDHLSRMDLAGGNKFLEGQDHVIRR